MNFLEILNKRYASKAMNGQKVPQEKIDSILEAIRLTPTSSGLQPFEVFVITNDEKKEELKKAAWNQQQITDCSHLLVFAAWDNYTEERINHVFNLTHTTRGFKDEGAEGYRQKLISSLTTQDSEVNFEHASKQTYIALMAALAQSQYEGVDSTPMEGFIPTEVDRILNLREKGLRSTLLLPLGYRDEDKDWLLHLKKVRKPMNELVHLVD